MQWTTKNEPLWTILLVANKLTTNTITKTTDSYTIDTDTFVVNHSMSSQWVHASLLHRLMTLDSIDVIAPQSLGSNFHPMNHCARYYYWLKLTTNNITNNNQQNLHLRNHYYCFCCLPYFYCFIFFHVPLYWRLATCILYQEWIRRRYLWGWQVK